MALYDRNALSSAFDSCDTVRPFTLPNIPLKKRPSSAS